ncbi:MAG: protein-L-isoaspartate(D-aspartate) O-methyltransferase [Saprospiraceae bacterium]
MSNRKFVDDYLHLGHRRRLVSTLRTKGITNEHVLEAISKVPRHWFVEQPFEAKAYEDRALPIAASQTISQPYTVAYQSSLLRPAPRLKVLEIGTGSGYQAAVLGKLGMRVFTLERQEQLYTKTRSMLAANRFGSIRCFLRDGYRGLPVYGPYDRILVTAGAPEVPGKLLEQLTIGGILVIPVGVEKQEMLRITRTTEDTFNTERMGAFRFVPFAEGVVPTKGRKARV